MGALGGRPPVPIDLEELEKLSALQCTIDDLAAWFRCARRTILNRLKEPEYREAWESGQGRGRISLRRKQFALAEKNAAMCIWLGKQYLGQRDHTEHTVRTEELPAPDLATYLARQAAGENGHTNGDAEDDDGTPTVQ